MNFLAVCDNNEQWLLCIYFAGVHLESFGWGVGAGKAIVKGRAMDSFGGGFLLSTVVSVHNFAQETQQVSAFQKTLEGMVTKVT